MSNEFNFKQFSLKHDRCAMKIGTDGVLLGAWSDVSNNPYTILDIGAGSGLLSLMLAQRSVADQIESIEIDAPAYEQAVENFEQSPWSDRLFCYHASLLEFVAEVDDKFDVIVSNPPFFSENFKSNDQQRDLARFQDALPFEHLLYGIANLLTANGIASLIIPYSEEEKFISLASEFGLFPTRLTRVRGRATSPIKRSLVSLSFTAEKNPIIDELFIEIDRHVYSAAYINLTKDFYLKM